MNRLKVSDRFLKPLTSNTTPIFYSAHALSWVTMFIELLHGFSCAFSATNTLIKSLHKRRKKDTHIGKGNTKVEVK